MKNSPINQGQMLPSILKIGVYLFGKTVICTLLVLAFSSNLWAQCCLSSSLTISTGYDPVTSSLVTGSTDPKWTVCALTSHFSSEITSSGFIVASGPADVITPLGTWATNPASKWINCFNGNAFTSGGTYTDEDVTYCRDFSMACAGCIKFNITVADCDWITSFEVDGPPATPFYQTPLTPGSGYWHTWASATFMVCSLSAGTHTIKIKVHVAPTNETTNGSGFNLVGNITCYDPTGTTVINGFRNENSACCASYQCNMPPNTGILHCCPGYTQTLSNAECGGTWSCTDPHASVSLTGTVTAVSAGTAVISYTDNCGRLATSTFTVDVGPVITGSPSLSVCQGGSDALSASVPGGTWHSNNPAIATISSSGVVTGVAAGTVTMVYTPALPNCPSTFVVTVNPLPASIGGSSTLCLGSSETLSDVTPGGTFSSSNPFVASITPAGVVTGISTGTATITYTLGTGCYRLFNISVVTPGPIGGGPFVFYSGGGAFLTDLVGGGTWSSASPSIAYAHATTGAIDGMSAGVTTISYTIPPGCTVTHDVTVQPVPTPISGVSGGLCLGHSEVLTETVDGGTWSYDASIISLSWAYPYATVTGISSGSTVITYTLPDGASVTFSITISVLSAIVGGPAEIAAGTTLPLSDPIPGGTWTSSNPSIATVGYYTGVVAGISGGIVTITYTLGTDCSVYTTITVDPVPGAIGGGTELCVGHTETLTNPVAGGTWEIHPTSVATIGATTGIVTGVSGGTAIATYTLPDGYYVTLSILVAAVPPITGAFAIPEGGTTTLSDALAGGLWSSSDPSTAGIVAGTGVVTGVVAGVVTITYTWAGDCYVTHTFTVDPLPGPIGGSAALCLATSETLTDPVSGGTWTSANTSIATVGLTSGIVYGASAGVTTITYTLPDTYYSIFTVTVSSVAAITGTLNACAATGLTLGDATPGGTWTAAGTITPITSTTVNITGLPVGNPVITYTYGTCSVTVTATVYPSSVTISGPTLLCGIPTSATYTADVPGGHWWDLSGLISINFITGIAHTVSVGTENIWYSDDVHFCYGVHMAVVVDLPPAPISGNTPICVGATLPLGESATDGAWATSNPSVATIDPTGMVTSVSVGVTTISYTNICGTVTSDVTINALPSPITGDADFCAGSSLTLSDPTAGGTWSLTIAPVMAATINATTGVITTSLPGTGIATYTLPDGCSATAPVNINVMPDPISGPSTVCVGAIIVLTESVSGGDWSTSDVSIASVGGGGMVTGMGVGVATISYAMPSGCLVTHTVTVNPPPALAPITGPGVVGEGLTIALADATPGGTWGCFYGCPTVADIDAFGNVTAPTGTPGGGVGITYTVSSGECSATAYYSVEVVVEPLVCVGVEFTTDYYVQFTSSVSGVTVDYMGISVDWGTGAVTDVCPGLSISAPTSPIIWASLAALCPGTGDMGVCITGVDYMGCHWDVPRAASCCVDVNTDHSFVGYRHSDTTKSTTPLTGSDKTLSIVPNPNKGSFKLSGKFDNKSNGDASVEIADMMGRIVYKGSASVLDGNINAEINLNEIVGYGVFIVRISNDKVLEQIEFSIQR